MVAGSAIGMFVLPLRIEMSSGSVPGVWQCIEPAYSWSELSTSRKLENEPGV